MRTKTGAAIACGLIAALSWGASAGVVSPRGGGPLPEAYLALKKSTKDAFTFRHAWLDRRARQVAGDPRYRSAIPAGITAVRNPSAAVSGTFKLPVVLGLYSSLSTPPFTRNAFDQEFFTGPWATGTMKQYWSEVSYNLLDLTGTVFDWVPLSHDELYYTGGPLYNGLTPGISRTGDMIKEIVDALDPGTDFGQFDDDGPDGIPNSGDDDGFVDALVVMHPTEGAECVGASSTHMWSHSYRYSAWPVSGGAPYVTNDPAAGGGFIKIDDYILVPSFSCGTGQIEIGVICHELGHAFGLPDLYDPSGLGYGIGYWGLMGAGNWNTPSSPAHLSAWSRDQLGWLNPIALDWRARSVTLDPVETTGEALRMDLPTRRFRRLEYVQNNHAMVVGCTPAEALARHWPAGAGYGNGWHESIFHEFSVDASRPVAVSFSGFFDTETGYDFGRLLLEVSGRVDTLAVYTGGPSAIGGTIDFSGHLPAGPCAFTLRFEFTSDVSFSNEDGYFVSHFGQSFNVDNVHVDGGGLAYFSDFELDSGAWRSGSPPVEYFIVENRRKSGFDANLFGQGMLIWHAENSVAYTELGNSGGVNHREPRGLALEEADGDSSLLTTESLGGNRADAGDPFPGTSGKRAFGPATRPASGSNNGVSTPVAVTAISASGSAIVATFKAGMPAPAAQTVIPDTIDKELVTEAVLDIRGSWMLYGATAFLSLGGDTVRPSAVDWRGEERIVATFPTDLLSGGAWDVSVVSGDGQTGTKAGGLLVQSVYVSASVTPGRDYLLVDWRLDTGLGVRGCLLYRYLFGSMPGSPGELMTPDTLRSASGTFSFRDETVLPLVRYTYRIVTFLNGGREEDFLLVGGFSIPRVPFTADQNYPNPFTSQTTVSFFNPAASTVTVDVYDVSGAVVDRLAARPFGRGTHTLLWKPAERGKAAGIYFCVFRRAGVTKTVKMIYMP